MGEPFLSGFNPATLDRGFEDCGLLLLDDLNGSEVAAKYDRTGENSLGQSAFSHVVLARTGMRT